MTDVLVRGLSADEVVRLDERAEELGLTRQDLLRRTIRREIGVSETTVTWRDLQSLGQRHRDARNDSVLAQAWRRR